MHKLSTRWLASYNQLIKFKSENGHTNVPRNEDDHKQLGLWVKNQRYEYQTGKMNPKKIESLNAINFNWDLHDVNWYEMLEDLKRFIAKNGHANVPQRVSGVAKLSIWVSTQRLNFKRGRMSKERFLILEAVGFDWAPHETKRANKIQRNLIEQRLPFMSSRPSGINYVTMGR